VTGRAGAGVRVRGTCTGGHVTETTSTPGRTTWHGPCANDDCELKVYARRVPGDTPAEDPTAEKPPPADPHTVIEVPAYRDDPKPSFDPDDRPAGPPVAPAGDAPAGGAASGVPSSSSATKPGDAGGGGSGAAAVDVDEQPRGLRGRLRARRSSRAGQDEDEDHFFPTVGF
jgi:hypothetical protein